MKLLRKRPSMTPADAARSAEAGSLQLVDVRGGAEVAQDRVALARHIPLDDLARRLDELDRTRPVAFLCRSGQRSRIAVQMARARGFDAFNVDGGAIAWRRELGVAR